MIAAHKVSFRAFQVHSFRTAMSEHRPSKLNRRRFLASASVLPILAAWGADAATISGKLPWSPFAGEPPRPVNPLGWYFLKPEEVVTLEAIVDRLIPADHLSPGGKEAGCVVFIDRQLAGPFGEASRLYTKGPFHPGQPTQGYQNHLTPAGRYREGLAALNDYARAHGYHSFAQLPPRLQDDILKGLESGAVDLALKSGLDTRDFFELVLQNTMEGFFADPLYGGNRNMVGWKLVGFPGARYDYRDHIAKHNVPYPRGPISIYGAA
jgi:gluconate 2-dehydrogenase gamma chain